MSEDTASWIARAGRHAPPGAKASAATTAAVLVKNDDQAAYKAWGQGHPETTMLDIRTRPREGSQGSGELLPLHYLMRVSYDFGPHGDHVTLMFADCLVTVSGRNLEGLRLELIAGKVGFLEEHDSARWGPAGGGPVIEEIKVIAPGRPGGRA